MAEVPNISLKEFNDLLNSSELPIIVDCWAPWCGPCKSIEPLFVQLAEKYKDKMIFVRMNMDTDPEFAQRYMISSLPTFVVFKEGKPYNSLIGANRKKLQALVEDSIK